MYQNIGGKALDHMVELKTNYRCHAEIMKLPNRLFYDGILIPKPINSETHPKFPYPLVFVCSSLQEKVDEEIEAKIMLQKVNETICRAWPENQWGAKNLHEVGLITPSQPQVSASLLSFNTNHTLIM